MKKTIAVTFAIVSLASAGVLLAGCGSKEKKTEVTVFAAKSLNGVMDELCEKYNSEHPNVTFQTNYDSSGTLMTQIKEGAKCNIFFSAGVFPLMITFRVGSRSISPSSTASKIAPFN